MVPVAPASGASVPISIVDNAYQPAAATVNVGDTVTWCNNGSNDHSVVPDEGSFGTGALEPGECSAPFRVTTVGTFKYDCSLENMRGSLTVRQAPPPSTTRPPAPQPTSPPATVDRPSDRPSDRSSDPGADANELRAAATATTRRSTVNGAALPAELAAPPLGDAPLSEASPSPEPALDGETTTTRGDIAINEVDSEPDPGQRVGIILSAAVAALGAGYLVWHLRFGRR